MPISRVTNTEKYVIGIAFNSLSELEDFCFLMGNTSWRMHPWARRVYEDSTSFFVNQTPLSQSDRTSRLHMIRDDGFLRVEEHPSPTPEPDLSEPTPP